LCAVPIALWLLRPGVGRPRALALFALGGLPWAAALLAYNAAITGSPWQLTTTPLTASLWFADGVLLRGGDMLASHLLRHLLWTPPVLVVAYIMYLRVAPGDTRRGGLDWILVLTAATLYFYVERGGNQYGPRFHYEAFLFAVLVVAGNMFRLPSLARAVRRDRIAFAALVASVALMPASFAVHAAIERAVVRERMDPFVDAKEAALRNALVLIQGRVGTRRSMAARDLTRNGIDYGGSVLYGVDPGDGERCAPGALVPGRATYLYEWDPAEEEGTLRRLVCPETPPVTVPGEGPDQSSASPAGGAGVPSVAGRGVPPLAARTGRPSLHGRTSTDDRVGHAQVGRRPADLGARIRPGRIGRDS